MPLPLAFVFHFNQHSSGCVEVASRACYRGLLGVLRAHPRLKFNLHLSGTLLRALPWFDAESVEMVRAGLADGQFELLGSAYAQNVLYASDDWDNAEQIALHRAVLRQVFGAAPTAFWLAERCWRQSLLPLLTEAGYTTTLIEDHILHAAGLVDPVPATTRLGDQSLAVVYDDTILRHRVNYAAWFGRRGQLFKYLESLAARPGAEQFLVAYAEDAEAHGLWPWERGYLPQAAWAHLDALLGELEASDTVALCHLSQAQPRHELPALPDGAAQWMDVSLATPGAPYHEDGYRDWFDFNERSPKLEYFRRFYGSIRARLQALGSARSDPGFPLPPKEPAAVLYRRAIEAFCHHQYEFGCVGVGGRGDWGWENARSAFLYARAVEVADDARPWQWVEDVDGDAGDEQLLCNGRQLAVFSSRGGRLQSWLDLDTGREWVGNLLAVPPRRYVEPGYPAEPAPRRPARWLPETFEASLKGWSAQKQKEAAPTAMGRYLPAWIFEREPAELTVYHVPPAGRGAAPAPPDAQTGALVEVVTVDGEPALSPGPDGLIDYRFEDGGITFLVFAAPDVLVEKHVTQAEAGLVVRYTLDNRDEVPHRVGLQSRHELCPDYAEALGYGRAAYEYVEHDGRYPAVRNTRTGTVVAVEPGRDWQRASCRANVLALEITVDFKISVPPRSQEVVEIVLNCYPGDE
jgi:hypothetical protein